MVDWQDVAMLLLAAVTSGIGFYCRAVRQEIRDVREMAQRNNDRSIRTETLLRQIVDALK